MPEQENSYQSWRRDQIRLAALAGTAAAGFWVYRKLQKHSDAIDDFGDLVFGCIGTVILLPIWVPSYMLFRRSIARNSCRRIEDWEKEAANLLRRHQALEERARGLAVGDQELARQSLGELENALRKLTRKVQRRAELWATYLYEDVRRIEQERADIVSRLEHSDQSAIETALRQNSIALEHATARLRTIQENYGVEPYKSMWQAAQDRFSGLGYVAVGAGIIAALTLLWSWWS